MKEISIWKNEAWEVVARIDDCVPMYAIEDMGRAIACEPIIGAENVAIIDGLTGEVLWDAESEEADNEPWDIDDDCGFDPYEGCFTYDC